MEAKDPLSDLADIHLPEPVSFWPPAPLWWMLAALLLAGIAALGFQWFRRWQRGQRLQHALAEIRSAQHTWQAQPSEQTALALLYACNSVLKRVALVHYSEAAVAALHGKRWLNFLDESGNTTAFTTGAGSLLADGSYRRSLDADANTLTALLPLVEAWVAAQYQPRRRKRSAGNKVEAAHA